MAKLRITYTKSAIGYSQDQKETIRSLGLHKLNSTAVQEDTPAIRGMVFKVRHLVRVEELGENAPPASTPKPRATLAVSRPQAAAEDDDLERIEGIGPKIAGLLREAGITTFEQLAATEVARLEEILRGAKLGLAAAETWPEQAALAAAGKWDEFTRLTDTLKGGRRS
jgi:large subunit ribosomal protein L30